MKMQTVAIKKMKWANKLFPKVMGKYGNHF